MKRRRCCVENDQRVGAALAEPLLDLLIADFRSSICKLLPPSARMGKGAALEPGRDQWMTSSVIQTPLGITMRLVQPDRVALGVLALGVVADPGDLLPLTGPATSSRTRAIAASSSSTPKNTVGPLSSGHGTIAPPAS